MASEMHGSDRPAGGGARVAGSAKRSFRFVFLFGLSCSTLLLLNIFWDLGGGVSMLMLLPLLAGAVAAPVLLLCGYGWRRGAAPGWLVRPAAAACIVAPMALFSRTNLPEILFLWLHERHYLAVMQGPAQVGVDAEVMRFDDNTVFVVPRMLTNYFLVYEPSGAPRLPAATAREGVSFWQHRPRLLASACHLQGNWYGVWYRRDE